MNKAHTLSNWINNIYCGDLKIIPLKTPFQYKFNGMDFITYNSHLISNLWLKFNFGMRMRLICWKGGRSYD